MQRGILRADTVVPVFQHRGGAALIFLSLVSRLQKLSGFSPRAAAFLEELLSSPEIDRNAEAIARELIAIRSLLSADKNVSSVWFFI